MNVDETRKVLTEGPERSCIGCGVKRPKTALLRLTVGDDGQALVDGTQTAPGRGAYLCGTGCLKAAIKRRAFQRAYRGKANALEWNYLEESLQRAKSPDN